MVVAGLFGILVPVTLKKMNIDPAIASSVFVTTITDVIGFLLIFPISRKFIFSKFSKKYNHKENIKKKDYIDGDFEDIEDDHDKKL